jgi:hypothetical protein
MGCKQFKIGPSILDVSQLSDIELKSEPLNKSNQQPSSLSIPNIPIDLSPADKEAFSTILYQQRQTAIDNLTYRQAIDQWQPTSIEQLINLIQQLAAHENQIDRACIIFYWISQNISYDTVAFFSNQIGSQNTDTVFQDRKAVCDGYSSLYAELCNRTGLKCRKVSGYAKGFGFDIRQTKFDKTNHAWNIITLDNGHSYFVESTWGSGHLEGSTHYYKQEIVPHHFLCRPEHMIYRHLPEDDQYQLLAHPLTLKQYLMLPQAEPAFFEHNLKLISPVFSPKVDLVQGKSYGLVLIRTPHNNVELSGFLEDSSGTKIDGGHFFYSDKEDPTLWQCYFAPSKLGKHNIFIFSGTKDDNGKLFSSAVIQLAFDVNHLPLPTISYPLTWPHFFDYNLEIIKPMNSRYINWPSDTNTSFYEILVRSPDSIIISTTMKDTLQDVNVEHGTLVNFDCKTNLWQCFFAPSNTDVAYKLTIFAKRLNEQESHCAAQLDLRPIPSKDLKTCMQFPEIYFSFYNAKCNLIEPLNGILKSGSTIHFRCQIPGAREVNITIDDTWMKGDLLKANENDMFERDIQVGQKEVPVWVKFNGKDSSCKGLLKYTVN